MASESNTIDDFGKSITNDFNITVANLVVNEDALVKGDLTVLGALTYNELDVVDLIAETATIDDLTAENATITNLTLENPLPTISGGTGLATIGTAGQVLAVNSTGTGLVYTSNAEGSVTSVSALLPLASSGGTTPTISIPSTTGTGSTVVLNNTPSMIGPVLVTGDLNCEDGSVGLLARNTSGGTSASISMNTFSSKKSKIRTSNDVEFRIDNIGQSQRKKMKLMADSIAVTRSESDELTDGFYVDFPTTIRNDTFIRDTYCSAMLNFPQSVSLANENGIRMYSGTNQDNPRIEIGITSGEFYPATSSSYFKIADVTGVYSVTLGTGTASFSMGTGNFSVTCAGIGAITSQTIGIGGITLSCLGSGAIALTTTTGLLSLTSGNLLTLTATTQIRISALTTNFLGYTIFNRQVLVSGLIAGTGGASFSGGIKLNGGVNVTGGLTVAGTTKFTGTTSVTGPFTVTGPSTVTGLGTFRGGITAQGSITMTGSVNVKGPISISGNTFCFGTLNVSRQLRLFQGAQITGTVAVQGTTTLSGSVNVRGPISISGNTFCFGTLNVSRQLRLFQGAQITGTVAVQGTTTLSGSVNVRGPISISGNTFCFGFLNVSRQVKLFQGAQITGKLTALGPVDITGNTTVRGFTNLTGNCTITGTGTIQGKGTIRGGLEVNAGATINFGLTVNGTSKFTGPTSVIGKFSVSGQLDANGGIKVLGSSSFTGSFTASGMVSANGGLKVQGLTTLTGGLTASGIITANGGLNVTGLVSLKGATSISGATTVSGLLTAQGGANITGAVGIQGPTNITGAVAVQGPVNCTGLLTSLGGAAITGLTFITGGTQITGGLNITGILGTQGIATFFSSTYMLAGIGVTGGTTIDTVGQRCDITGGKITLKSQVDAINFIAPEGGVNFGSSFGGGIVGNFRVETQNGFTQFATGDVNIRTTTQPPYTGNGNIFINTLSAYSGDIYIAAKGIIAFGARNEEPGQNPTDVQLISLDTSLVSAGGYTLKFPANIGTANSIFLSGGSSSPLSWLAPGSANTFLQSDGTSLSWVAASSFTDWANPGAIGSGTPNTGAFTTLSATSFVRANSNNQTDTVNLNPAVLVYFNDAANQYGMDLGYNSSSSRFRTRIFAPTFGDISLATGTGSTQSAFTDRIIIRGDTGDISLTSNTTVNGSLNISGLVAAAPIPSGINIGVDTGGWATIQLNGSAASGGYIDFSTSGTDFNTRIIGSNSKLLNYIANNHNFTNTALTTTFLKLNDTFTANIFGTAGIQGQLFANSLNTTNSTTLNSGVSVFNNGVQIYGMDLGYNPSTLRYRTRVFAPNEPGSGDIALSTGQGANQSGFTDRLIVRGDTGAVQVTSTLSVVESLFVNSNLQANFPTALNPGIFLFQSGVNNANSYGMDLGYNAATDRFRTRIFTSSIGAGGDISLSTGYGITQSASTDRLIVRGDTGDVQITSTLSITGQFLSVAGQIFANGGNTSNTVAFNSGITVYNNDGYNYGMDLGYNATTSRYRTRIFCPNVGAGDIALSTGIRNPINQSSYTDRLIVRGDTGNIELLSKTTFTASESSLTSSLYTFINTDTNPLMASAILAPNISVGNTVFSAVGKSLSTSNCAFLQFTNTAIPYSVWSMYESTTGISQIYNGNISITAPTTSITGTLNVTNGNIYTNQNIIGGISIINNGNLALSVSSPGTILIRGGSGSTITLPDATTLIVGFAYTINNNSNHTATVNRFVSGTVGSVPSLNAATVTCIAIDPANQNGTWDIHITGPTTGTDWATPGQIGSAVPNTGAFTTLSATSFVRANSNNQADSVNLNPAVFVWFNDATNQYGMDLGYNSTLSRFRTRIFAPTFGDISLATGTGSTQSAFTDRIIVRGDTGNVQITSNTAIGGYLHVYGAIPSILGGDNGIIMGLDTGSGYASIQLNGTGTGGGYIDFSQNGTDYYTRILGAITKFMYYYADKHEFSNAATSVVYMKLNDTFTANILGTMGVSGQIFANSGNTANSTTLNSGVSVFNNGVQIYGMDLGYNTTTARFRTRIFAPNNPGSGDIALSTGQGANQSGYTDRLIVRGDTGNVQIIAPITTIQSRFEQLAGTNSFIIDATDSAVSINSSSLSPLFILQPNNATFTSLASFGNWPANSNQSTDLIFGRSADNYQAGRILFTARQPNTGTRARVFELGYSNFPFVACDQFNTSYFYDAFNNVQAKIIGNVTRTGLVFEGAGVVTARSFQSTDLNTFRCIGTAAGTFPDGYFIDFKNVSNVGVGSISFNGANTVYNSSSDYRLKTNIQPLSNPLGKILQLNPKSYTMIESQMDSYGFIAHEVAEVIPELVMGEKDALDEEGNPRYQQLDYSRFTPYTVGAIKELFSLIETLQSQIQTQQSQIETLQNQILLNQ